MKTLDLSGKSVIVIGGSAGGLKAVSAILGHLTKEFQLPIVIVLHRPKNVKSTLINVIQQHTKLIVKEADEKETLLPGYAYVAPANYHLLIEADKTFGLDYSETVKYSRPSIDLTFESVARVFGSKAIGILLTGANKDGSEGLFAMKNKDALCIVQDPASADVSIMPQAAITRGVSDHVIGLNEIGHLFKNAAQVMRDSDAKIRSNAEIAGS